MNTLFKVKYFLMFQFLTQMFINIYIIKLTVLKEDREEIEPNIKEVLETERLTTSPEEVIKKYLVVNLIIVQKF